MSRYRLPLARLYVALLDEFEARAQFHSFPNVIDGTDWPAFACLHDGPASTIEVILIVFLRSSIAMR